MMPSRDKLVKAYGQLRMGDPLDEKNHVGPLIDKDAVNMYLNALKAAKEQGANHCLWRVVCSRELDSKAAAT